MRITLGCEIGLVSQCFFLGGGGGSSGKKANKHALVIKISQHACDLKVSRTKGVALEILHWSQSLTKLNSDFE